MPTDSTYGAVVSCTGLRKQADIHPKAMPVVPTTADEVETWMTAPPEEALKLQRPLPDGTLKIVATGEKEDHG